MLPPWLAPCLPCFVSAQPARLEISRPVEALRPVSVQPNPRAAPQPPLALAAPLPTPARATPQRKASLGDALAGALRSLVPNRPTPDVPRSNRSSESSKYSTYYG